MNIPHETLYPLDSGTDKDLPETIRLDDGKGTGRQRWRFCFGRCEPLFIASVAGSSVCRHCNRRSRQHAEKPMHYAIICARAALVRGVAAPSGCGVSSLFVRERAKAYYLLPVRVLRLQEILDLGHEAGPLLFWPCLRKPYTHRMVAA